MLMTKDNYKTFARNVRVHGLTMALRLLDSDVPRGTSKAFDRLHVPIDDYLAARAAKYRSHPGMRNDWVIKLTTPMRIFMRFYPDCENA